MQEETVAAGVDGAATVLAAAVAVGDYIGGKGLNLVPSVAQSTRESATSRCRTATCTTGTAPDHPLEPSISQHGNSFPRGAPSSIPTLASSRPEAFASLVAAKRG